MLFEGPDGPFPKVIGWVLGGTFAVAFALGALFSFPYAFLGYLIGQLAIVLIVSDYLGDRVIGTSHVMLLVAVLSLDERRLFQGYPPFFLIPIAAATLAHFLKFTRVFGVLWLSGALWYGFYVSYGFYLLAALIPLYYIVVQMAIVRLSPLAHYEAAAKKGDRRAVNRLELLRRMLIKRADAFGLEQPFPRSPADEWDR
jgi:hypothetical protein